MNTKRCMVRLYPHDKFFFGGENTFGGKDGSATNYLVKSNHYPQQTGLLGLVRHQLLIQNGHINQKNQLIDKGNAAKLIGPKSFMINEPFEFGAIKSISPLFYSIGGCDYFPCAKEYQKDEEKSIYALRQLNFEKPDVPKLENYDPKIGLPDLLVDKQLKNFKPFDDVFTALQQTGIRKDYEGKTQEKSYYLQTFYRFKDHGAFTFLLELDENAIFESQSLVIFGGEQGVFRMEVCCDEDVPDYEHIKPTFEANKTHGKLVLLSDAYLKKDDWSELSTSLSFSISDSVNFRFLKSTVQEDGNYAKLGGALTKSEKYNLIKRGSVFFGEIEKMESYFKSDLFQNIGYNQYTTTEKQP